MADDRPPVGGEKPRSPEDHDVTGTGSPRWADDGLPQAGAKSSQPADQAVVTGMTSTSHPAESDELNINRSGSGGSGGSVDSSEDLEGSTGETLAEQLGGEEEAKSTR